MNLPDSLKEKANLSDQALLEISERFERKQFYKGEFLFRQGEFCRRLFFMEEGFARVFYYTEKGKEVTAFFVSSQTFTTAPDSYFQQIQTHHSCELLEDSVVYSISYDAMAHTANNNLNMAKFAFYVVNTLARRMSEYTTMIRFQTAEERYKCLLKESPCVFQKTQLNYIASFLGITPETLSRLRAEKK